MTARASRTCADMLQRAQDWPAWPGIAAGSATQARVNSMPHPALEPENAAGDYFNLCLGQFGFCRGTVQNCLFSVQISGDMMQKVHRLTDL